MISVSQGFLCVKGDKFQREQNLWAETKWAQLESNIAGFTGVLLKGENQATE